jgi:hypothetical protein
MKQIGYVHTEVEKDGHKYSFSMPMGSPLADASEVSFKIFKACDKLYREAIDKEVAAQEAKEKEKEVIEAK